MRFLSSIENNINTGVIIILSREQDNHPGELSSPQKAMYKYSLFFSFVYYCLKN